MSRIFTYYSQYQSLQGSLTGLPGWARGIVFVAAIPGILLLGLSLVAIGVSLLALLVLTVPAYRALSALTRPSGPPGAASSASSVSSSEPSSVIVNGVEVTSGGMSEGPKPSRRQIDVRIVEESE